MKCNALRCAALVGTNANPDPLSRELLAVAAAKSRPADSSNPPLFFTQMQCICICNVFVFALKYSEMSINTVLYIPTNHPSSSLKCNVFVFVMYFGLKRICICEYLLAL